MEFLTCKDVAEYCKVTPLTVRRWCYSNKIKYLKPAGRLLFLQADVDSFLTDRATVAVEVTEGRAAEVLERASKLSDAFELRLHLQKEEAESLLKSLEVKIEKMREQRERYQKALAEQ